MASYVLSMAASQLFKISLVFHKHISKYF